MPKVEIIGPDVQTDAAPSQGTQLFVDGVKVEHVRNIDVHLALHEMITIKTEVFASGKFVFSGRADLHVTVVAMPGYDVLHTIDADGTEHYRSAPLSSLEAHVEG